MSVRAGSLEFEGRRSVIATVRDITRERRMEQEIKDHAERLAAINEIANAVNLEPHDRGHLRGGGRGGAAAACPSTG